ncbi:MAG: phosphate/phosphite/phosphonate ABC transporter substrate-binding protein [Gallionellaceae bacterium]|nr:MAG: phosphate/phosphite/phosphonate ABC transporter substrate-binding protein [Gallionellaceae bacterium]
MKRWGLLLAIVLLSACGKQEESYRPGFSEQAANGTKEYVVGIHPLHNPKRLFEIYGPIVAYVEANIPGAHFRLEASRNYEEFEKKLYSGHFDFAMPNPYQTVRSLKHGYRIFGKMGNDEDFRGIILVRKDSGIRTVSDLKGKKVAYPAATALAATMMPQYYLHTHGLDVNRDIENLYVGSQESSIMNVLRGHVAAGATWPLPWKTFVRENPALAGQLEVKWQTGTLPNNGWVVRKNVPPELAARFAALLFGLEVSARGKDMLAHLPISRFEVATETTYEPVREFLKIFSATVRPIEY